MVEMKNIPASDDLKRYFDANRKMWDSWTGLHEKSDFYNVEDFKSSRNSLKPIEIEEVGDVSGKSMLHLQCHFGLDSLSWAAKGCQVTGVDFSQSATKLATALSKELNIPAQFICSDIFDLPNKLDQQFDIVFTSYGVLNWLSDLNKWAETIARFQKPSGLFYIIEFHPLVGMLNDNGEFEFAYFNNKNPERFVQQGSYAAPKTDLSHESFEWAHGLGEIVTALLQAGLRIEYLHEFPFSSYNCYPFLEEKSPDQYVLKNKSNSMPLMFSIKASL